MNYKLAIAVLIGVPFISFSQTFKISGKVVDGITKTPLEFASVYLIGTTIGTYTNRDGSFILETPNLSDSIAVSEVGFIMIKKKLTKENFNHLEFELQQNVASLSEVSIIADPDPGKTFMKKVISHKPFNNPDKYKSYSYKSYNRSELDLNNVKRDELKNTNLKAVMLDSYNIFDTSNTSKSKLPIYFSETLADNYHSISPYINNEIVKAKKTLGLETDKLLGRLEKFNIKLNVYDNWLPVFDKTFISPLSDNGSNYYKYYINDSVIVEGHTQYQIQFIAKHKYEDTFSGMMWINDSTFSISSIEMKMSKTANLNFVNSIKISVEFGTYTNGDKKELLYMPKKYVSEVAFESGLELLGIPVSGDPNGLKLNSINTTVYSKLMVNANRPEEVVANLQTQVDSRKLFKNDEYWELNRIDTLTLHEKAIYLMMDTLKANKRFERTTKIAAFAGTGYWDLGCNWRLGPYSSLLSYSKIEGVRIRAGVWSLPCISEKWNVNGYLAIGTKDNKFKGGFGVKYLHSTEHWSKSSIYTRSDYDVIIDYDDELDRDNIVSSLLRKNIPSTRTYIREVKLQHEEQLNANWINQSSVLYKEYNPLFNFQYHPLDPNSDVPIDSVYYHKLPVAEFNTNFRFAHKERTTILNYDLLKIATDYPIVVLNYTYGFEIIKSEFAYHKVSLSVVHNLKLSPKTRFYYHFSVGKTFGTLPYILLNIPRGNEFYVSSKYSFNTMSPYEFAADRYASIQTRLSLGGLLFDRIPFMQKLGWRERATFNSFWGDMTLANKKYNEHANINTTGNTPFAEAGVGIENIFHVLSIEYIWRLNHLNSLYAQKGGLYAGITLNF